MIPNTPSAPPTQAEILRPEPRVRFRLPLAKPVVTYVLLGLVAVMFVIETVAGGSTNSATLERLGAQINTLVATGQLWRLFSAMFLHIGLQHIAFNGWALFSLGRDVEAFYGSTRFALIYLLAGLWGNVAFYLLGGGSLSAGASGAVFGLIGAEVAFFIANRLLFGKFGRQRLLNLAVLIGINLVFGFTVPGINNLAHVGGLVGGLVLGLALAPRYRMGWVPAGGSWSGQLDTPFLVTATRKGVLEDKSSRALQILAVAAAAAVVVGGAWLGTQKWANDPILLRERAVEAYQGGDLVQAAQLLERASTQDPSDVFSLYNLGVIYLRQDDLSRGIAALERALAQAPDDAQVAFALGVAYAETGRMAEARPLLEQFLATGPTDQRADYARQILGD